MKRAFTCFEFHRQSDGKLTLDDDGASYVRPHTHPLLAGKEFVNETEILQAIQDHNAAHPSSPFKGEILVFPVLTFYLML